MARPKDYYESWKANGVLSKKLSSMKEMTKKGLSQEEISKSLGLSRKTLIVMKQEHRDVNDALSSGNDEMIDNLVNKMYELAMGKVVINKTDTIAETFDGRPKKRVAKRTEEVPPNFQALKYMLVVKGGRKYKENKEEIDLMEKKIANDEEVWSNEYFDDESGKSPPIRKQSKK